MKLSGYVRSHSRRNGGIKTIALLPPDDLVEANLDQSGLFYSSLQLSAGVRFMVYDFQEDEAEYRELSKVMHGSVVVQHELCFSLDKIHRKSYPTLAELIDQSFNGFIAIVVTVNEETLLVGYSEEFKQERPLKITSIASTTGKRFTDPCAEVITIESIDTAKARSIVGDLSTLLNR